MATNSVLSRPGFLGVDEYLSQPKEAETWLLKPLIPSGGAALIFSEAKIGKALDLATPIPTPSGWKELRDISPGDTIFGSGGQPITVVAESPIWHDRPCYKVTFDDDSSVIVDENHEWTVMRKSSKLKVTVTTKYIHDQGLKLNYSARYPYYYWRVPLSGPLQFVEQSKPLPLDPYCLGLWLGDGTAVNGQFTTADQELVEAWRKAGFEINKQPSADYGYGIQKLAVILRDIGLKSNKHIPEEYMTSSVENRKALLAGLMDTDGSVSKSTGAKHGSAEFYNTNKTLAYQVLRLARELGLKARIRSKEAKLYGKSCGTCYTVSMRSDFQVFRLERKAKLFAVNTECYRTMVNIEPVEPRPTKCLMVSSPDHLFLAGESCIPTHNSFIGLQLALAVSNGEHDWLGFGIPKSGKVLYLQLDTPRTVWASRIDELVNKYKLSYNNDMLKLADRDSIDRFPLDILIPDHVKYLRSIVDPWQPSLVIVDTLREIHSGDEDSSTTSRNVISNLVAATKPAALVIISHSRKPIPDARENLMADHRGSSYIVGRMDAIIRLTKRHLYYSGRSIEEGKIELQRQDNGLWTPVESKDEMIIQVLADTSLKSMREKARALASKAGGTEDAAMSVIRRRGPALQPRLKDEMERMMRELSA